MAKAVVETADSPEAPDEARISAAELSGAILRAGPGNKLKVRSHFLPDGSTRVGVTTWQSDFTKGPAVYYYRDPRTEDYIAGILPIGGETHVIGPPRFDTVWGDNKVPLNIEAGYKNLVYTNPVDPFVAENYLFELLPDGELAPEEVAVIQALEAVAV